MQRRSEPVSVLVFYLGYIFQSSDYDVFKLALKLFQDDTVCNRFWNAYKEALGGHKQSRMEVLYWQNDDLLIEFV